LQNHWPVTINKEAGAIFVNRVKIQLRQINAELN
jgi:hypothetical protein